MLLANVTPCGKWEHEPDLRRYVCGVHQGAVDDVRFAKMPSCNRRIVAVRADQDSAPMLSADEERKRYDELMREGAR